MILSKKIIIIAIIIAIVGGGFYLVIDREDPKVRLERALEQAAEELGNAQTWEEAMKADKKIQDIRKKLYPDEKDAMDANIDAMINVSSDYPSHNFELSM